MIGIAEDDLRTDLFQLIRGHRLYCGAGAHRHENRCFHYAVRQGKGCRPGRTIRMFQFKLQTHGVLLFFRHLPYNQPEQTIFA